MVVVPTYNLSLNLKNWIFLFLKEKVGIRRWTAVVIGFIGVVVVIKPQNLEFNFNINPKHTLHFNLAAHDRYIELPGDVPVRSFSEGPLNGLDGFSIDPRSTDTPRDFATNYGQKIFINSAYMPNNSLEIINDASYRFTKSQGFFFDQFSAHTDADIYI